MPAPYPYIVESTDDIFGWNYAIMPQLPGISLADQSAINVLASEDRADITRALARTLVEIQKLTWDRSGSYDPETKNIRPFPG